MANTFQFWDGGSPIVGSENSTLLTFQYWDGGFPYIYVDTTTSVVSFTGYGMSMMGVGAM